MLVFLLIRLCAQPTEKRVQCAFSLLSNVKISKYLPRDWKPSASIGALHSIAARIHIRVSFDNKDRRRFTISSTVRLGSVPTNSPQNNS